MRSHDLPRSPTIAHDLPQARDGGTRLVGPRYYMDMDPLMTS